MIIEIPDKYFNKEEIDNTPDRFRKFLSEWLDESEKFNFTIFEKPLGVDQMISICDIQFYSLCAHHLLPFIGKVHVGYIPRNKICGLSKVARVIDKFAHRPQLQEQLTQQIADYLAEKLDPKGVIVMIEAEHLCMSMRGIRKPGHRTITTAIKGAFTKQEARNEFLGRLK